MKPKHKSPSIRISASVGELYALKETIDRHNEKHLNMQRNVHSKQGRGAEVILAVEKCLAGDNHSTVSDSLAAILKTLRTEQETLSVCERYHDWLHHFFNELNFNTGFLEHLPPKPATERESDDVSF